ncbi:MAG: signal peptidase II [Lonepinella koalarum]|nr:signal peptidase II [Lonepinella koalarum]
MTNPKSGLIFLWLSAVAFIIDLFTKELVLRNMYYQQIEILPFFNLTYAENPGAAFSFLASHDGWQKYFFIVLALVISSMLIYFLKKNHISQKLQNSAYALIIGGALANMVDRAIHGVVIDFLDFYWSNWHYPTFNVADIAISVGAVLLAVDAFKNGDKQEKKK